MMPKVRTACIYPPIPIRNHDWCAWYDSIGEEGPVGYGCTEQEAIDDLLDNYPPEEYE